LSAATRTCPKCGGPLTRVAGDPARRTCAGCGVQFGVRPKAAAAAADPAPTAAADGMDPRLKLALLIGLPAAFLCLCLMGIIVLTVILWPRSPVKPALAVALRPEAPPPVLPAEDAKPAPAGDPSDPPKPPKKPDPPKVEAPPAHEAPPPLPPDPRPAPADPKPMPTANPPADAPPADPVNQAIDKAVAHLKQQALNGPPPGAAPFAAGFGTDWRTGEMGLIGLALLESGVPADDPAVAACAAVVRSAEPTCNSTYEMSISVWFLDRLGDPKDEDLIRDLAARLIAGQLDSGKWTYMCPGGNGAPARGPGLMPPGFGVAADLSADQIKELMETLDKYDPSKEIPAAKRLAPVCKYVRGQKVEKVQPGTVGPAGMMMNAGDLSLTQFAVLGLWVARKHRVPVDRSLLMTEAHVRAWQAADGGWSYNGISGFGTTDSMTCSGLMELAVGRAVSHPDGAKTEAADPQFDKGLEYLADLFGRGIFAGAKVKPANAAQAQNLAAAVAQLKPLQIGLSSPLGQNPANWKRDLKAFRDELERSLALDLPPDAKKEFQDIDDQIKKYEAARGEEQRRKDKTALEELLQKTNFLQGSGLGVFGLVGGPDRLLNRGKNDRVNQDDIYCLWSLERLCMVCDLKTVAGYDWYPWGAKLLVDHQNDDGGWNAGGMCPPVVETCMAVLFLKRVNVAKDLTAQLKTVAPVKDLSPEKLKFITTGHPPPGLAEPPPEDAPKQAPKP
jgi:hypothetical protein